MSVRLSAFNNENNVVKSVYLFIGTLVIVKLKCVRCFVILFCVFDFGLTVIKGGVGNGQ